MRPWEAGARLRTHFGAKECVVPDELKSQCSGDIVRAHTVPKSGSLKRISREGHAYTFMPNVQSLDRTGGRVVAELRGVNRASTFTGFCAFHDKTLFSPVEDGPMQFSGTQCFLLAYRAMAREFFLKRAQRSLLAESMPPRGCLGRLLGSRMTAGVLAGDRDIQRHKTGFDRTLTAEAFDEVRSYIITFEQTPTVMASGGLFPYECFDGTVAQDLLNLRHPAQAIYYTVFAVDGGGAAVFTWLPDSDEACERFITTLENVADGDVSNSIVRFLFEFCEN